MLFKYLADRGEDVSRVKISTGFPVTFKRNKHGDMVADVCNGENVAYMLQSNTFEKYVEPVESQPEPVEPIATWEIDPELLIEPPPQETEDADEIFVREWLKIRKDVFIPYVQKNLDRFNTASDEILNSAIRKWAKSTEEPWPGRVPGRSNV